MNALATLLYVVLSLFGIDIGSHVYVDRIHANGADTLYSKVVAQPVATRFECLRSASGQCYYTLYRRDCTPIAASGSASPHDQDCLSTPVERFAVASGGSRQIPALSGFRVCVGADADASNAGPDCDRSAAVATR